jgi:hypothetical protein
LVVDLTGETDPSGFSQRLDARSDVHPVTEDVAVPVNDVSKVNADTQMDGAVKRDRAVALVEGSLDLNSAADSLKGAGEFDEESVSCTLHLAALVLGEQGTKESRVLFEECQSQGFVGLGERRIPDKVRQHDGCKLSSVLVHDLSLLLLRQYGISGVLRQVETG